MRSSRMITSPTPPISTQIAKIRNTRLSTMIDVMALTVVNPVATVFRVATDHMSATI